MNRNKLKTYAPLARREFIQVVTDRAAFYGLTEKKIQPLTEQDDVTVIGGQAFPKSVAAKRKRLEQRIARDGFQQTMEAMAYTWFNRFVAIRYMELHGYLDHGYRVLSNPDGSPTPEIIEHAEHVDLPGIDRQTVVQMKLDGDQEPELYRMLLLAQCHALYRAMPFLFEPIDDETELLLPDNLLHSDSPIRKLVASIDEDDWQEVEIIGWLYQFYISEKKDQVIGKVVKSEDIPAATQLFTPNWIVKYLVQNSLGRLWMEHHPDSQLRAQMEYYIEPAEQTPEVQAQLQEIIRQRAEEHRGGNLATDERGEFLATDQHGLNTDEEIAGDPCFVRVSSVANSPCSFLPDDDGIIPITDTDWFPDDAANRVVEFIATAWLKQHLEENLVFIAESLGPKKGESSRDTIRRYLSQGFFKHHLSMYKRRPIYWKFTSGKLGAFECLVYLHRYHEGTLPRMRTEYVIPLLGRIEARIDQLKDDITAATSTAHGKRLQKERDKLIKQQAELQKFDEKLRHYADRRIQLDLDDGVKVNYGKFGDLLAEVKAVTGNA